ncbi:hypothetical protein OH76DRAFT_1458839 [Lentinus brumalis]|uniref:Transposase family Tnp2 protein n=1 Tax=Lentinus brumalis TaxID=2498619 RepID=A0A371CPR7_9APHY|nr:hypothetical protein OH76DRAFT_1458839 [Polyporus brumalis]
MKKPPTSVVDLDDDPTLRLSLRQFIANGQSEATYEANRQACMEEHPERELPTLKVLKKMVEELTGVAAIKHDMCEKSCLAYVGPHAKLTHCPLCKERTPRYHEIDGKNVARRTYDTYPFGPQAQALFRSPESAERMHHRRKAMADFEEQIAAGLKPDILGDTYFSQDFRDAVDRGDILDDDLVLMFSIDGAQLYESKQSDCWVYIWILFDLSPKHRYQKCYVLPGGIIPGPNKPKDIDSFLLPGLMHISVLQKKGLKIWDAADNRTFISRPIVLCACADCIAMAYINGLVGHTGAHGCRLWCPLRSRHQPGCGIYYPAMLKPNDARRGSDGDDFLPRAPVPTREQRGQSYQAALDLVLGSDKQGDYEKNRRETGVGKPSVFSGLPVTFSVPTMFPPDVMHHLALNIPDIMIGLFTGTFRCATSDSWMWEQHGEHVASMSLSLPSSFDRTPRNIAAKINSGYKAWEHMYHFYVLLPGLLYAIMDDEFYGHYCKLVAGARAALLVESPDEFRPLAHKLLIEFVEDFERLYYRRRLDRLHFCRHSIHQLLHLMPETFLRGPLWLISQWPMENAIGNLTREIGSDSLPYANFAERALRRCQVCALVAMFPALGQIEKLPKDAIELGNDYVLLAWGKAARATELPPDEAAALVTYLRGCNIVVPQTWKPAAWKWARLRLPNGQIARTAFGECKGEARGKPVHRSRMVKVIYGIILCEYTFAEVKYFFRLKTKDAHGVERTASLAMVSDYTPPDPAILQKTHGVLMVCRYEGGHSRRVVDAKDILTVVELYHLHAAELYLDRYFVAQKLGFDMTWIGRIQDPIVDDGADA